MKPMSFRCFLPFMAILLFCQLAQGQNIFSGERLQVVGAFNGYAATPYGTDYRTTTYRRMTTASGTPADGRGQWATTINVQNSGGDTTPINMPGGGGNGFLFISGPAANRFQNKWVFSGIWQGTVNGFNNISCFNCGNDMGLNMNLPGYYTFIFNDCGYTQTNARYYVGYTANAPVGINRAGQTINPGGSITVNITTGATPSPQENIYLRYTTGSDFSGAGTSTVLQASGAGTAYSATIPAQPGGTVLRYFVFSSTLTLAQLSLFEIAGLPPAASETDKNLGVLRFDDNGGANFIVLAPSAASASVAGIVSDFGGRPLSKARISISGQDGIRRMAITNQFGRFAINDLEAGQTYLFEVSKKGYHFSPRILSITEDILDMEFAALP